jgi:hypothetical protein
MATIGKQERRRLADADRARQKAQRREQQHEAEIDHLIETTGWAVCVADSADPADPAPHFAYTIGRTLKGQPELCTWSNTREDAHHLLNVAGNILERDQHRVETGDVLRIPYAGAWAAVAVPQHLYAHLVYARRRYTFLRVVLLKQVG